MTQYLQTKTDIFACGISHAGISDIGAYWGGGYWGYSYGETAEYGSFPWNNPDLFVKHSPLYNADKIRFIHRSYCCMVRLIQTYRLIKVRLYLLL